LLARSLLDRQPAPAALAGVGRFGMDDPARRRLLEAVGDTAGDPAGGARRREQVGGLVEAVHEQLRVVLDVGLLERMAATIPDAEAVQLVEETAAAAEAVIGSRPNLEVGLVAVANALQLPSGSALALMAPGRTLGWIAHAIEEHGRDQLTRPRARHNGPAPRSDS
jgi:citrate synthase